MQTWARVLCCLSGLVVTAETPAQTEAEMSAIALADLARTKGHAAVPDLLPLLEHDDWRVRWHAVRGIGLARADWLDERLARMLDDAAVAPMAACAIGQLIGQADRWPPMDRSDELLAAARRWRAQQEQGEGWITHQVAMSPDLRHVVLGQMHAERGTAYLVVRDALLQRERSRTRWSGPVRAIAFSGDSGSFAVSCDQGGVHVHARAGCRLLRRFDGHRGWIGSLALSHDGSTVASSAQDATLLVRKVGSGDLAWRHAEAEMVDLEFRPRGQGLVGADRSGRLRTFTDQGVSSIAGEDLPAVVDLAVSRGGQRTAVLHANGELSLWDLEARRRLWQVAAHGPRPRAVTFAGDGQSIATAGSDRRVRLWSAADGTQRADFDCERNVIALRHAAAALLGARYDGSTWRQVLGTGR